MGTLLPQALSIEFLANPLLANEPQLVALLEVLAPLLFPSLAGSLGTFPLPAFLGFDPVFVEADRAGQFISLFLDLQPIP